MQKKIVGIALLAVLVIAKSSLAQVPFTTVLDPKISQQNGSELTALFDVFSNTVQKEINNRLFNIQPANLTIVWPVNRIAEAPSYFDREQVAGTMLDTTITISNKQFSKKQDEVLKKVEYPPGSNLPRIDDIKEALKNEAIDLTLATRILFNRQTILQLLKADGATVFYELEYQDGEPVRQEVQSDAIKWAFRFYKTSDSEKIPTALLAAVDVVTESIPLNLVRSGNGVEYLKKATSTAQFILNDKFLTVPTTGQKLSNPNERAGGGEDKPLTIEFAEQGLKHLFERAEQAEEESKVSIGVALGVVASSKGGNDQDSFAGINVGFNHKAWEIASAGLLAGLNSRKDLFFGPSVTFGRILTAGGGWRGFERNGKIENALGAVFALNFSRVQDGRKRAPAPINVVSNNKVLTKTSPDQSILDAALAGILVQVVDTTNKPVSKAKLFLQPKEGSGALGIIDLTTDDSGEDLKFPEFPGAYTVEIKHPAVAKKSPTPVAITLRPNKLGRLKIKIKPDNTVVDHFFQ